MIVSRPEEIKSTLMRTGQMYSTGRFNHLASTAQTEVQACTHALALQPNAST
jgi:hypothetical protein